MPDRGDATLHWIESVDHGSDARRLCLEEANVLEVVATRESEDHR